VDELHHRGVQHAANRPGSRQAGMAMSNTAGRMRLPPLVCMVLTELVGISSTWDWILASELRVYPVRDPRGLGSKSGTGAGEAFSTAFEKALYHGPNSV